MTGARIWAGGDVVNGVVVPLRAGRIIIDHGKVRHSLSPACLPMISRSGVELKFLRQRGKLTQCGFAFRIATALIRHQVRKADSAMRTHLVEGQLIALEEAHEEWARHIEQIRRLLGSSARHDAA